MTKNIGKVGVSKVSIIVNQVGCNFHKIDQENDIGNDAFIELIESDEHRSFCLAAQIKAGDSYVRANKIDTFIKADRKHLEYWNNINLPVIGFVYNPNNDIIYWVDIKDFITLNPSVITDGPYNIPVPINNIFSENTFNTFKKHILTYNLKFNSFDSFHEAISNITEIDNAEKQYIGIKNLFTYHRNRVTAWYEIFNLFSICNEKELKRYIITLITLIPGHGDIFWHKKNMIKQETIQKSLNILKKIWGEQEIRELLRFIDLESGIQRGSMGQNIYAIIDRINDNLKILQKIAFDRNTPTESSFWAFYLFLYDYQFSHSLDETIDQIHRFIFDFPRNPNIEMLEMLKTSIKEQGQFHIY